MITKTFFIFALAIGGVLASYLARAEEASTPPSPTEAVLLQITSIVLDEDRNIKIQDTEALIKLIAGLSSEEIATIDRRAVLLLAQQLTDSDNGVRMWVAVALAQFGCRAESALPALEKAYQQTVDKPISDDLPLLPSASAHYEIGNAIRTIKQELKEAEVKKRK